MGQCSELPEHLWEAVEERVVLYADKVRLRSVCASWMYSTTLPKLPHQKLHQSPCLLLPTGNDHSVTAYGLFSPLDKKFYHLELPELANQGKSLKGSSHGWVVTSDDCSSLCLLNPLSRAQLKLPPRSSFPDIPTYWSVFPPSKRELRERHTLKIILSSSPANDDYVAVAAYHGDGAWRGHGHGLAYCRKGYTKWVHLHGDDYADMIFFKGQLYALDWRGNLLICEVGASLMKVTKKMNILAEWNPTLRGMYLVEHSGGLLRVDRMFGTYINMKHVPLYKRTVTYGFKVYKLDVNRSSWFEVRDLGGDSLFLGRNSSLSISLGDFPGYKGNCIYFTDVNSFCPLDEPELQGTDDMGIYNIDDGLIESLHVSSYINGEYRKNMFWPSPIWVMPKAS